MIEDVVTTAELLAKDRKGGLIVIERQIGLRNYIESGIPIDGEVTAVHGELSDHLDILKNDPYGEGWLLKITYAESQHFAGLMTFDEYQKQCAEEGH